MLPVYLILRVYSECGVHFVLRVLTVLEYWRPKYCEYWEYEQYSMPKYCEYGEFEQYRTPGTGSTRSIEPRSTWEYGQYPQYRTSKYCETRSMSSRNTASSLSIITPVAPTVLHLPLVGPSVNVFGKTTGMKLSTWVHRWLKYTSYSEVCWAC